MPDDPKPATYADITRDFETYADAQAEFPTYADEAAYVPPTDDAEEAD